MGVMQSAVLCMVSHAAAAAVPFGPSGSLQHPVVGPVAAVPGNGPEPVLTPAPEEVTLHQVKGARDIRRGGSNPLFLLFLMYKDYFSPVDGGRCQHYPTCSAYGAQAVGRYNVLGVFMTMSRLWAGGSGSTVRSFPLLYGIGPTPRFYDPVEDAAHWFSFPLITWLGPPVPVSDKAKGRVADAQDPPEAALQPVSAPPTAATEATP